MGVRILQILPVLVLLHGPDGHEILLNPDAVASMHAGIVGKPNELVTGEVGCVVNTWDGKFVSIVERCEKVQELIQKQREK